jgi:hypothetical protein
MLGIPRGAVKDLEPTSDPRISPDPLREEPIKIMLSPEYLRRQAENCLRIARSCFDLASAERLRLMAAELNAKAVEMDEQNRQQRSAPRNFAGNPTS